ncbi:MAG: trehalase family glycosidase [Promethearchaeati archaeon SRVP18_Atabeyarchaeia-1]
MTVGFDPLSFLSRRGDKWFLGNGVGLVYAPSFPEYLDVPGFYDYADYFDIKVEPVFTVNILDEDLKPIRLQHDQSSLFWTPAYFRQRFFSDRGIEVIEHKTVTPNNALTSTLQIAVGEQGAESPAPRFLHLVAWVAYPSATVLDAKPLGRRFLAIARKNPNIVQVIGSKQDFSSFTVNLSQGSENKPRWELTPFADKIWGGLFKDEVKRQVGTDPYGLLYIGLHYPLKLNSGGILTFSFSASFATREDESVNRLEKEVGAKQPDSSEESWRSFFSLVPEFHCSDPYLEKYYWYRWYGLHLMSVEGGYGNHTHPCVYEGLRVFRKHISYSAQCHVLETRWMSDPVLARGCIMDLFSHQKPNGFLPGIVGFSDVRDNTFYHANWGRAVRELDKVHPDKSFLEQIYEPLRKYLNYFKSERDSDEDYLYDIIDQYESGQEMNPRYLFVDAEADKDKPLQEPLEGVDATVYIYELYNALASIAAKLGRNDEAKTFANGAAACRGSVRSTMWDKEDNMFYDVRPSDHWKTKVKAAIGFYPFICDIASPDHLPAIRQHLLNKKEFWTPFPVATLSMDNEYFSPDAEWKGKRMMCPWNGRVWPMTNSHIAEALVHAGENLGDRDLRATAADFISRYIRMMFFNDDVNRPNCYEHYNPITGGPCDYRGVDDYQHSWVVDLIIKYVCGIRPMDEEQKLLVVDPLPFNLRSFSIERVRYQGHVIGVTWAAKNTERYEEGLNIYVDGKKAASSGRLERHEIQLQ